MSSLTACVDRPLPNSDDDFEIRVEIEGSYVPYMPARTNGDPEDCYPAEGGYAEDVTAYVTLPPQPGKRSRRVEVPLTAEEIEDFSERLAEEAQEDLAYEYEEDEREENYCHLDD